jgi:hypothetical protein
VGTIVFQLAIAVLVILLANNWIKRRLRLSVLDEGLKEDVEMDTAENKKFKEGI